MMKATDIMHPEDMKAFQMLQSIPFIDKVCRKVMEVGYERIFKSENLANMVKATEHCMPHVFSLMAKTAKAIGINTQDVYVYNDPVMNAWTYGETNPFVCISSSCIEKMGDEELMCLMAHECGHILCKHTLYQSVVNVIWELGERLCLISYSLTGPIYLALQYWSKRSELSADRCATVVASERVFQRMMIKLASGLPDIGDDCYQLVRQANEYHKHENRSWWNKVQQNCRMAFHSHPQMVNRAYEIDRWKKSLVYKSAFSPALKRRNQP